MADLAYRNEAVTVARGRTDWGAIWGGTFTFIAIWSVFGALGLAIFASNASAAAARPIYGQSYGLGAWVIILTIIAMYVAGRETGRLAEVTNRHDGLIHGMMMFGLSVAAVLVIASLGGSALSGGTGVNAGVHSAYVLAIASELGWMGFVALFLGWLAAMWGASSGVGHKPAVQNVRDIRSAA
jgi:hypothetical protein